MMRRVLKIAAMVAAVTLLGVGLWRWNEARDRAAMRAEIHRQNTEQTARSTAQVQARIEAIEGRDPAADARRDAERGDPTPIGLISRLHHDQETIRYPLVEGCRLTFHRREATGKWLDDPVISSGLFSPPNHHQWRRVTERYVTAYNRAMLGLRPREVAEFCARQVRPGSRSTAPER